MNRHDEIKDAYKNLGGDSTFYDGMITCSTYSGKAVSKLVWNMNKSMSDHYVQLALSGIPQNFSGRMLEIPVGTGVLTMPVYQNLPNAEINCMDYSPDMMERAKRLSDKMQLQNINFIQGDVGNLPFEDNYFDLVLSLNGFHAFPDKEAAYNEVFRVLKPGGILCGCFYIKGENRWTDFIIDRVYTPMKYFTPPFETAESLRRRLESMYKNVEIQNVESIATFNCQK